MIGQGTWNIDRRRRDSAITALQRGIDAGMTHIDTAEMYDTEDLVADAIAGRRAEVFVVSKVLPEHASRRGTLAACEHSLKRLRTDWIDCYLLHWRGRYPLEETFGAFRQLQQAGKILSWGVSNFDVADLEEAWQIDPSFVCNQVLYSASERAIEHHVLPWCAQHAVAIVAYSPFAQGHFPSERSKQGKILSEIAASHGATPRQVLLRFLVRHASVFAIPKASNPAHALENAGAGDLVLSEADHARLEEAFPKGPPQAELPVS